MGTTKMTNCRLLRSGDVITLKTLWHKRRLKFVGRLLSEPFLDAFKMSEYNPVDLWSVELFNFLDILIILFRYTASPKS